jgi:ABC-type antimicrobial peptide transport system permease subunit
MWLLGLGLALGLAGAAALRGVVAGQLYGVKPLDPTVLSGVVGVLLLVGLASSALPARRASRVDPVTALRGE